MQAWEQKIVFVLVLSLLLLSSPPVSATMEPGMEFDLGGRRIGVSFRFHGITPLGERGDFDWLDPDPRLTAHIESVEEMFNASIEFVQHPWEWHAMNFAEEIMAGDDLVSVFETDAHWAHHNLYPMAMDGFLQPLDDVLDEAYYQSLPEAFRSTESFRVRGQTFGFEPLNSLIEPVMIKWNLDLFEREGLPDLYELKREGEWTWEAFAKVAMEAHRDTTGDGEVDQFGVNVTWNRNDMLTGFIFSNDGALTAVEDGDVVYAVNRDRAIEALEFLQELVYEEGVITTNGFNHDGRAAMVVGVPHTLQFEEYTNLEDRYGVVPLPMGPQAEEYVYPLWNRWMAVIPIIEPEPRAVVEVVNALRKLTEPYIDVPLEEWEDTYWEEWSMPLADRESLLNWQEAARNRTYTTHRPIVIHNGLGGAMNAILDQGDSVSRAVHEVEPQVQTELDALFNE